MNANDGQSKRSGWRILIVGTGGQGVLTAARLLSNCMVELGHDVVSGQLHGMAQRGGSVQSSVMINCGISPVIAGGQSCCVLGFEPVETARALPQMSARSVVYMNTAPVIPYVLGQRSLQDEEGGRYPDVGQLVEGIRAVTTHVLPFEATALAREAGSVKVMNTIMLGCLLGSGMLPCSAEEFWSRAARGMPPALAESNTKAFFRGVEVGGEFRVGEAGP